MARQTNQDLMKQIANIDSFIQLNLSRKADAQEMLKELYAERRRVMRNLNRRLNGRNDQPRKKEKQNVTAAQEVSNPGTADCAWRTAHAADTPADGKVRRYPW